MRDCRCKGEKDCRLCHGSGQVPEPDWDSIVRAIRGRKGGLRVSPSRLGDREYFVWRLARFFGGRDVTLPIVAYMRIHGDPWEAELRRFAEAVALAAFGTHLAGPVRWAPLLTKHVIDVPGLPASAYHGGPVVLDGDKPDEEAMELR